MSESLSVSKLRTVGEHVELDVGDDIANSPRYNEDIAPTRASQRTWTRWNVASLWVGMAICVPTYTLGGVLTAYFGLSVAEALWTILIANIVVLIPLTLNAYPGTRYGIPCPVVMRASFGIIGSNVPSLIRAIVACGWFGVQTLFGGIAIHLMLSAIFDSWAALGGVGEVLGFFIFWVANLAVVIRGAESIKLLEALAAPLLLIVAIGLVFWALPKISLTEVLATPATRPAGEPLFGYFMAGLTAMVGFWATLSLNIPDFSRYARTQRSQVLGQIIGLPLTMLLFAGLGVILTAASVELTGEVISDPINLIGRIDNDFLGCCCHADDHPRNDLDQHGREYRVAHERVSEHRTEVHQRRPRCPDYGLHRHCIDELGVAQEDGLAGHRRERREPVFELAHRLLQPAGPHCRHHDRRLFPHQEAVLQPAGVVPG